MKLRQANPNVDQTKRLRTACQKKLGAVGGPGRPTDLARGPNRLSQAMWHLLVGPLGRFGELHPVAPCYKYKGGVQNRTHTHHTPLISSLAFLA